MSEALSTQARSIRASRIAIRKIASFEKRFGQAHLFLLYHAAFPLALTSDLLYRLWASFQRDVQGQILNIPWIAVSDILLSSFCQEVGQELYEMDGAMRDVLLKQLRDDPNLGQQRIQELSDFLLEYVHDQLQSNDLDIRDFAQTQRWTVLAYSQPGLLVSELALTFNQLELETLDINLEDRDEMLRIASLIETFSEPLIQAGFEPLLTYACAIANWAKGNPQEAAEQLEKIIEADKIQIAGVDFPIPKALHKRSEILKLLSNKDYHGQSLRGFSFKGQNLTRANFSNAKIHGANLSASILVRSNFSQTQMGLQKRWAFFTVLISLTLSIFSNILITLAGLATVLLMQQLVQTSWPPYPEQIAYIVGLIVYLLLCVVTIIRPLKTRSIAGALGFWGTALFATGIFLIMASAIASAVSLLENVVFSMVCSAIATVMAFALPRVIANNAFRIQSVIAVTFTLTIAYLVNAKIIGIVASAIISIILALGLIWGGGQFKRMSHISFLVSIFTIIINLVIAILLIVNQVSYFIAIFALFFTAILGASFIIPLIVSGQKSLSGAVTGSLIVPGLIITLLLPITISTLLANYNSPAYLFELIVFGSISLFSAILAWSTVIAVAFTFVLLWTEANNISISIIWTLSGIIPLLLGEIIIVDLTTPLLSTLGLTQTLFFISIASGTTVSILIFLLATYIGWQALKGNPKYISIRQLAVAFAAKSGTSFRGADLTDADFTDAILKSADFREANLTGVRWFHARKIEHACFDGTYMESPQVQQLAVTGIGQGQNWNRFDLEGINLQQANLADASFVKTNLKNANLRNTDLSRAQLIGTNLDQADLFGACLTGAYIQDIQITDTTRLKGIDCQYFYRRRPTQENPDPARYPEDHRQILRPGELAQFLRRTQTASS